MTYTLNNQEILSLIASNTNDLITVFKNDRIEFISPSVFRILGYTQEEFLHVNHLDLIHRDDRESVREILNYRIQNKITEPHTYVYRQRHKNGSYKWIETNETKKIVQPNNILTVLYSRDITERINAENSLKEANKELYKKNEELRQKEKFLQAIADTSPALMYLYDIEKQRNVWVNRQNYFGLSDASFIEPEIHPEDIPKLKERLKRLQENPDAKWQSVEYRMRTAENHLWRWFHDTGVVFKRDETASVKQILCSAIDVTEQKRK